MLILGLFIILGRIKINECSDGIQNGPELGIDCGDDCPHDCGK